MLLNLRDLLPMPTSLSVKIIGILVAFSFVALTAIGTTLAVSWQLKGSSAAINDAGSLRMQIYAMAHLLASMDSVHPDLIPADDLAPRMARYQETLRALRTGDPKRPLFIPGWNQIPQDIANLEQHWKTQVRPLLQAVLDDPQADVLYDTLPAFNGLLENYIADIDAVVHKMERFYARSTDILQVSQITLVVLAVIGTLFLIHFFFVHVIRPIGKLREGIERIEQEDFSARTPDFPNDELGQLSAGFNRTAAHLQALYATLEQRVADKTRNLTEKNRELEILYAISGLLHEPGDVDDLCRSFLRRVQAMLGADASSVRLLDSGGKNLCITVSEDLDEDFLANEAALPCGDCMCGIAAARNQTFFSDRDNRSATMTRETCREAGYPAISATAITVNKRPLGVYNLYFSRDKALGDSDRKLLEALGQQLGTAIDNVSLHARERELAVSEERNLLARELHDSIAQGLAFLNLQVQMLEGAISSNDHNDMAQILTRIRQAVQESYDDIRELLVHFRTRIGQQNLDAAIEAALRRLAEQTGIATHFDVQGDGAALDPETETQLLYIVQEALSNVRKHANARVVRIWLRRGLEGLSVSVRDDGIGFDDVDTASDNQTHIGLHIMRERAMRIGGQILIRSACGKGTEIRLDLPRKQQEDA